MKIHVTETRIPQQPYRDHFTEYVVTVTDDDGNPEHTGIAEQAVRKLVATSGGQFMPATRELAAERPEFDPRDTSTLDAYDQPYVDAFERLDADVPTWLVRTARPYID